jgi:acylphosphatase
MMAIRALVSGRVQGVFFRQSTRQAARRLGLVGWVRNLADGRVEVWAQGGGEAVEALLEWLWLGPPEALVTGVESQVVAPDPTLQDFLVTR